jgi:hypothetical protein
MSWTWRSEDAAGAVLDVPLSDVFTSQSDAESWIGEFWPDLSAQGVAAVSLLKDGQRVYGPMLLEDAGF